MSKILFVNHASVGHLSTLLNIAAAMREGGQEAIHDAQHGGILGSADFRAGPHSPSGHGPHGRRSG